MSLPGIVAETVAQRRTPAEIYAPVPVPVRRSFALFLNAAEGEEFAAGVVENAVYHYVDSGLMAEGDKFFKVFIGSPCWWSTIAPPLKTLLTQIDLSGKTIAVFETNLGSGMGDVEKDVKALFPKSTFKPGIALWGSSVSGDKKKIEEWLTENSML